MKNNIKNYIHLDNKISELLWNEAIIVFDSNVLLELYRYSKNTRTDLIFIMETFKNRLWLPHQACIEFANNRVNTIHDQIKAFKDFDGIKSTFLNSILQKFNMSSNDNEYEELKDFLNECKRQF